MFFLNKRPNFEEKKSHELSYTSNIFQIEWIIIKYSNLFIKNLFWKIVFV